MKEIIVGPFTFVGELAGSHVHVRILGAGAPGHRPLCGSITVRAAEWDALDTMVGAMLLTAAPQTINNAELARVDLDLAKARAELAATKMLFEEQGKSLAAARASVAMLRERVDTYMPIDSVLGDWDWKGIVEDGCWLAEYDGAIEAAAKALAHVEAAKAKESGRG